MDRERFEAVLMLLVPQVIRLITESYPDDEIAAVKSFYASDVYESLENEETKLWHLSALSLFTMYDEERRTGTFTFPEEV